VYFAALVEAVPAEQESSFGEEIGDGGGVTGDGGDEISQGAVGWSGNLDLATRFDSDQGALRHRQVRAVRVDCAGSVRTERGCEAREFEWRMWIECVVHCPLQLDAHQSRWTMLETHRGDVRLSSRTIVQRSRDSFGRRLVP
jgi:hypothetical protein